MKKTGIIKAISPKPEGKNAFTLKDEQVDGHDLWFNGFSLDAEKGDEIEFELTINEDFNNFSKVKVLKKVEHPEEPTSPAPQQPPKQLSQNAEMVRKALIELLS